MSYLRAFNLVLCFAFGACAHSTNTEDENRMFVDEKSYADSATGKNVSYHRSIYRKDDSFSTSMFRKTISYQADSEFSAFTWERDNKGGPDLSVLTSVAILRNNKKNSFIYSFLHGTARVDSLLSGIKGISLSVNNWAIVSLLDEDIPIPAAPISDNSLLNENNPPSRIKGEVPRFSVLTTANSDQRAYYLKGLLVAVTTSGKKGEERIRKFFISPGNEKDVFVEHDENGDGLVDFCFWRVNGEIGGGIWDKTRTFFPITSEGIPLSPKYDPKAKRQRIKLEKITER